MVELKKENLGEENMEALKEGFANLEKHIENVNKFGVPAIVAINQFPTDTEEELEYVLNRCRELGAEAVLSEVWAKGGEGGIELAEAVVKVCETKEANFAPIYDVEGSIKEKIEKNSHRNLWSRWSRLY